jgi:hypothetical protein
MYRCTLAASWQLQAGELHPDECIEDIFAGGDGWTPRLEKTRGKPRSVRYEGGLNRGEKRECSDSDSLSGGASGASSSTTNAAMQGHINGKDGHRRKGVDGDALSIMSNLTCLKPEGRPSGRGTRGASEVDELGAREDLVSWRMTSAI